MRIGEYLRNKREEKDLSLREAAKLSGMSHVNIREMESEVISNPSFERIINLLNAYHADITDFLQKTGYLPANVEKVTEANLYRVPLVSWSTAEKLDDVNYALQSAETEGWITSDVHGGNMFALKVMDDTMEPEFREGDIIIVNPELMSENNDYVIVKNDKSETTFKQLKIYGTTKILHPLNPKYPDIELTEAHQYKIIGKVVKKEKRY